MKLIALAGGDQITLSNDFLWEDEHKWVAPSAKEEYSLSGALIIQVAARLAGRPITLKYPDESMAWVTRSDLASLRQWAAVPDKRFRLVLEYPSDTREFLVMFRHSTDPIEAEPVKGFPEHSPDDWFRVTIKLIEVL